ncbi:MAG: hypothetical protein D6765_09820 [Bacteroidetes bacterium]|nr:MAG: hypothetical protein D6765_09820 [Bacteroidota bacterium]
MQAQPVDRYCNERFRFCLEFPTEEFPYSLLADNGDGVTLLNPALDYDLKVVGSYNVLDWSVEELLAFHLEGFAERNPSYEIVHQAISEHTYELALLQNGKLFYQRVYWYPDWYLTLTLSLPQDSAEYLDHLLQGLHLEASDSF